MNRNKITSYCNWKLKLYENLTMYYADENEVIVDILRGAFDKEGGM